METDRIKYFNVVAQTESIRRAAELLKITPSALSKSVAQLEAELGVKLITPAGRGIALTREGQLFARKAMGVLSELEDLKNELLERKTASKTQPLKIATFETFSTYFLTALDAVGWSNRGLILHEGLPGEIERAVEQGQVDLGITYMPIAFPHVEHLKILSIEMGVFKRRGTYSSCQQQDLPFVMPVMPLSGAPSRLRGLDGWPDDAYDRNIRFEVTLMESALELCRQGRCAGYFPLFIVQEHNRKYQKEFHLERHASPYRGRKCFSDVFIVKRKDVDESSAMKTVARMIRTACRPD